MREELARQLWFWHSRDVEGEEHVKTFAGSTYTERDWMELLTPEEQAVWLDRADRVIGLLSDKTVVDRICFLIGQTHDTTELWKHMRNDPDAFRNAVRMGLRR
jgi:DNA-binding transcriptional regulator/RsmH inhibitor MraZ